MGRLFFILFVALGALAQPLDVPDLSQRQSAFPGDGSMYCGPVAISNSLAWLARRGYPRLCPGAQLDVALRLGELMHVQADGTPPRSMVTGLEQYLQECGYSGTVSFCGWRPGPAGPSVPTLEWLEQRFSESGCVWLNVGWYRRDGDDLARQGGHWVTLVGCEAGSLLVHDPSPRSGKGPRTERLQPFTLRAGQLRGSYTGLPRPAAGYLLLTGLRHPEKAPEVILDCALALRMK